MWYRSIISVGLIMCLSGPAFSHDLLGLIVENEALDAKTQAKFERIDKLARVVGKEIDADPNLAEKGREGWGVRPLLWDKSSITVCFFGGDDQARQIISDVASEWTEGTGISFDFGSISSGQDCNDSYPSDIRVSFDSGGFWSYVGTKARFIKAPKATLNLQGMGNLQTISAQQKGVVLHEFGHALGFQHEHQAPASACENEFNWDYLYSSLGWPKDTVDRNLRRIVPSRVTNTFGSSFDTASTMLYALARKAFKSPDSATCYIPRSNNELSSVDREVVQHIYPPATDAAASPMVDAPASEAAENALKEMNDILSNPSN